MTNTTHTVPGHYTVDTVAGLMHRHCATAADMAWTTEHHGPSLNQRCASCGHALAIAPPPDGLPAETDTDTRHAIADAHTALTRARDAVTKSRT